MDSHLQHFDESARLDKLHALRILDTGPEDAFDALCRLAAQRLGGSAAALSLLDAQREWFKARLGFTATQVACDASFAAQVLRGTRPVDAAPPHTDPLVVELARLPQHADYARMLLGDAVDLTTAWLAGIAVCAEGQAVGALIVAGTRSAPCAAAELQALRDLALMGGTLLEARLRAQRSRVQEARVRTAIQASEDWLWETDADGRFTWVSDNVFIHAGIKPADVVGRMTADLYVPEAFEGAEATWQRYQQARAERQPFFGLIAKFPAAGPDVILSINGQPVFDSAGQFRGYRGACRNITRRNRTEIDLNELNALKRDVQLMEQVLEAEVSLAIMVSDALDPDWPVIYANPAFERLTGYARAEVLGHGVDLLLPDDPTEQTGMHELRAACVAGRSCTAVIETRRRDGSRFLNQWHVSPVRNAQGRVTHFISVLHDVTERTREAEKLRVSEELYRSVAAAISDGLMVVTLDGRTAAVNPAACRILGVTQESLVGHRAPYPFDLLEADLSALPHSRFPVRRVLKEGAVIVDQVVALRRSDGDIRWLSINAHPLRMAPDEPVFSAVATFRDITEARQAAQALKQSEERWKFALEGAGDGVWDWDVTSERVFYSPRWKAMLGLDDTEVGDTLREWLDRIHPDDKAAVVRELHQYVRGARPAFQLEYRMRHKSGRDVWVLSRGKIVDAGPSGQARRVVGTHSDVTRQREAEDALRDKRAAELASQAKSAFLSRMSHEIRTPLNAVLGFAQLLKLAPREDETARQAHIDHILRAGQHLLALVNDVLDLQRVEEGRLTLELRELALDAEVNHCLSLLTPQAESARVSLLNLVPSGITVPADEQRLRQVLLNIGSNAIKYNRAGGQVRWSVEFPRLERVVLVIEDDGAGMSPEQLAKLFQPFERLGKETSSIEGSGLGLIIARSLVAEMNGALHVSSRIGMGTRVSIELPCLRVRPDAQPVAPLDSLLPASSTKPLSAPVTMETSALQSEEPDPDRSRSRALRLMYVEDNRINALLFEQALKLQQGFDLRIAEDGQHALEIAGQWVPDVLVLDAHLPGMSGFEALQALRTLPGLDSAPAFMCSADAMPEDVQRARDAGFIGYWTKPIEVQRVLADLDGLRLNLADASRA